MFLKYINQGNMFLKKYYPQGKFELYGAKNQFLWGSSFDLDQWFF